MQQNRCKLFGDRDETIDHISECSELTPREYKTRYNWVAKVIHWELCKKFKSVLEKETHKILWNTEIQREHLMSTRRWPRERERTCRIVNFAVPTDPKMELKKSKKYLDFTRELKKVWNLKVTVIPIVIGALRTVTEGLVKKLEDVEIRG